MSLYMSYTLKSLRMFIGPYLHALMYNMLMHLIQNPWIHWMTELDCTSINTFSAALDKINMERASIWRTLYEHLPLTTISIHSSTKATRTFHLQMFCFFLCVLLVRCMAFCSPSACRGWDLALNSSTSFSVWMSKQSLQERSMQHGPPVSMKQNKHFFCLGRRCFQWQKACSITSWQEETLQAFTKFYESVDWICSHALHIWDPS